MTYPTKPQRGYSFTGFAQSQGDGSFPGLPLDVELDGLKQSTEQIIEFLTVAMASDGRLQNGSVTRDKLASDITVGIRPPRPWAPGATYVVDDTVFSGYGFFICVVPHTSSLAFSTDQLAGRWVLLADFTELGDQALTEFSKVYLGPKSADPALDNDGLPLQVGALYFNTPAAQLRVFTAALTWAVVPTTPPPASILTGTVGGTANAITLTPASPLSSYQDGQTFYFVTGPTANGAGGVTLNVSGLGARPIRKGDGSAELAATDLPPFAPVQVVYESAGPRFRLYAPGDRPQVTPERFGAVGDGATNDAAALQAAIDFCAANGGGQVILGARRYNIGATTLLLTGSVQIIGAAPRHASNLSGVTATQIRYGGTGAAIESATKAATRIYELHIENVFFTKTGTIREAGSRAIDATRMDKLTTERCSFSGFEVGVLHDGSGGSGGYKGGHYRSEAISCATGWLIRSGANEVLLLDCNMLLNTVYGVDVQDAITSSVTLLHCRMESNATHIRTAGRNTRVRFGRMEASTVAKWETTATAIGFSIEGVHTAAHSGAAAIDAGTGTINRDELRTIGRGTNQAVNHSFEQGSGTLAPWGWALSNATLTYSSDSVDGGQSVLLTATATSAVMFQDWPIPPALRDGRRRWLIGVWAKRGTSAAASLRATPQDNGGITQGFMQDASLNTVLRASTVSLAWEFIWLTVTPNASATRIRVGCEPDFAAGAGTALYDGFVIVELDEPTRFVLAAPGDLPSPIRKDVRTLPSYTNGGGFIVLHSLAVEPSTILVRAVCATAELGYAVGDKVPISYDDLGLRPTATNIAVRIRTNGLRVTHAATGADANLTPTNWTLEFVLGA